MDEARLKDALRRAADRLEISEPPVERFVQAASRRSRRRRFEVAGAVVAATTAMAVLVWAVVSLSGVRREAVDHPPPLQLPAVARFDVGGRPLRAATAGGAAWVVVQERGMGVLRLVRVDENTRAVTQVRDVGQPQAVVADGQSVWLASCVRRQRHVGCVAGAAFRLDPITGAPIVRVAIRGWPLAIGVGDGSVWVASRVHLPSKPWTANFVDRIDAATGEGQATISVPQSSLKGLAAGDGAAWITTDQGVARINEATNSISPTIEIGYSMAVAAGGGSVWVNNGAMVDGSGKLVQIDAATNRIAQSVASPGYGPVVYEAGRVWLATAPAMHLLELRTFDPGTGRFTLVRSFTDLPARWLLDGPPFLLPVLAVGEGAAWVGTDQSGEIIRLPLPSPSPN